MTAIVSAHGIDLAGLYADLPDNAHPGATYYATDLGQFFVCDGSGNWTNAGTGGGLTVTVTSAELLALFATPVELVPAPGAGKAIIFDGAVLHKPAGTAYDGIAAGEDLSFKYTNASGLAVGGCETTGFLDQATAQTRWVNAYAAASGISSITPVANAALVLHMLTAEIATGDSDLLLQVHFRIVPTVLS